MDFLRIAHYLAGNYWNTIGLTPKEFVSTIAGCFSIPRSRAYFDHTLSTSWNDEVFFYICLKDLSEENPPQAILDKLLRELKVPSEFQDLSVSTTKADDLDSTKKKIEAIITRLSVVEPWLNQAHEFHMAAKEAMDVIFLPNLVNGIVEQEVLDETKRIDILYQNQAIFWFFNWLNYLRKVECQFIPVECKNYSKDPKNPEIDQLLWRFGKSLGKFWILVLNGLDDKDSLLAKLKLSFRDDKWIILYLEKKELLELLDMKKNWVEEGIDNMMMTRFKEVTI